MTDASDRGWGPGYPTDRSADMVDLYVDGAHFPGGVHHAIHDLFELLLTESVKRGYLDATSGLVAGWCWGYSNRVITGTTNIPSNHSWGLAVDINAPRNSYGSAPSTWEITQAMADLWGKYDCRWGGDYSTTKDPMHMEFMGTPDDAKRLTAQAESDFAGGGFLMGLSDPKQNEIYRVIHALGEGFGDIAELGDTLQFFRGAKAAYVAATGLEPGKAGKQFGDDVLAIKAATATP